MQPINTVTPVQVGRLTRPVPMVIPVAPVINRNSTVGIVRPVVAIIPNPNQVIAQQRPMPIVAPLRPPVQPIIQPNQSRPSLAVPITPINVPVARPLALQPAVLQPAPLPFRNTTTTIPVARPITIMRTAEPLVPASPMIQAPTVIGNGIMNKLARGRTTMAPTAVAVQAGATYAPNFSLVQETEETLLRNLATVWPATQPQLQTLLSAHYQNGTNIISLKRRDIVMEIIGMILRNDFDTIMTFIQDAPNPEFIIWDQTAMDESRTRLAREISVQQLEETGVKGIGKCRYCPSKELVFSMKQLQRGDEPMTVFVRCVLCGKQWKQ